MSQMFGVPPSQVPANNFMFQQPPGPGLPTVFPPQYGPLGSLAAYKGDIVFPVLTIGFFILGVVVVVKVLLAILGLIAAKLFHGFVPRSIDDILDRKRRAVDELNDGVIDQERLDGLTSVIMAALDSQQCQQRLMCEVGTFVQKYDSNHLIAGIVERFVPEDYVSDVRAFRSGGQCDTYQCGRSTQATDTSSSNAPSSRDVESL